MMKVIKVFMLLFLPSFLAMSPRSVFSQQAVDNPICYMRTANDSIVDLSILCKQNSGQQSRSEVQNIDISTSDREKLNAFSEEMLQNREKLKSLSEEMSQACEKLPTQCQDRNELLNQMRITCSTPNRCPNYINENLQRTRS
jgi:hypothetical protein